MRALRTWVLAIPLSLASPAAAAGPTINACKILTGGDLEAVFGQKVTAPGVDTSGIEGGGPLKGETKYVCAWWLGGKPFDDAATYVGVIVVSRPAQHEQERVVLSQYRASESEMKKKGVDEVFCLSVNDGWVMDAWGKDRGAIGKVTLIADGSGELTKALGLELDATGAGLGIRSQRYAAILQDGVVKHLAVEKPMKFEVSSAEAVLQAL